jgi:hypothetical protein
MLSAKIATMKMMMAMSAAMNFPGNREPLRRL